MQQTQLLMWQIRRSDGRNRLGSWYHCCIQVKFPNGIQAELDLQVPRSGFLEVEHRVQNLCSNCSDSQLTSFKLRLAEDLAPLNATIFAARLLKSSSLGELDAVPSSASVTSPMTVSDDVSMDNGGKTIHNAD